VSPQAHPDFDDNERAPWELVGAELLNSVELFLARFIAYPSPEALIAHVLWVAHTHRMDAWDSTPRIAFLSPEPGSGKSRALEVTELLVPRPVLAVNTTPSYLFRKVSDEAGPSTLLYDEIDTVFGPKAKDNEEIRGLLNAGHRKGAVAGRCVVRGTTITTEELPAYCAVALAGLDDLPDTIRTRSVIIRMRRRAPDETVEPFRHRVHSGQGYLLRDALASWMAVVEEGAWPEMPRQITDRDADVWEALFAVADAAGGEWPERARDAGVSLVTAVTETPTGLGIQLLSDIRTIFDEASQDRLSTDTVLKSLNHIEEAPWGNIRGNPLDARGLAARLRKYEVGPKSIRIGDNVFKGYEKGDFVDVWRRYLPASNVRPDESVTTDTAGTTVSERITPGIPDGALISHVTGVTVVTEEFGRWAAPEQYRASNRAGAH
jgi:hypothetical protein